MIKSLSKEELKNLKPGDKIKFIYVNKKSTQDFEKEEFFIVLQKLVLTNGFVKYYLSHTENSESMKTLTINDLFKSNGIQNLKNSFFRYIQKL